MIASYFLIYRGLGDLMKVLMITECLAGGVLTYLTNVCNELDKKGFKVYIIYSAKEQTPDLEILKESFNKGIILKEISFSRSKPGDYLNLYSYYKKNIESIEPDIVHFHSSFSGFIGRSINLFKNNKSHKSFYSPHGYAFLKKDNTKVTNWIFRFLENILSKIDKSTTILPISNSEYRESLKMTKRTKLVSTGIDHILINSFINKQIINPKSKTNVVSLGRLSTQKNPRLFLEIAKLCKDEGLDIKFTWIGGGELYNEVIVYIKENQLEEYVEITGWLPYEEAILQVYKKADIYLQTSLWEGLPLTILEAMYLEKAVVVNNAPGNIDPIEHGENGYISHSANEFLQIIMKLSNDRYLLKKISSSAKYTVEEKFLIRENVNLLVEQYGR